MRQFTYTDEHGTITVTLNAPASASTARLNAELVLLLHGFHQIVASSMFGEADPLKRAAATA